MMATAQGADHTAGNLARLKSRDMSLEQLLEASLKVQVQCATSDSIGLCIFGRTVTDAQYPFLAEAANATHGTAITPDFFTQLGADALKLESEFNTKAGFGAADDELPSFFYTEPLAPANQAARFHVAAVHEMYEQLA